jgi:hypothetical protein
MNEIIYPENPITKVIAEITFNPDIVKVRFEKNKAFIEIVKSLKFSWNPGDLTWYKHINEYTGAPLDRAAELGNRLLNAGIPISIDEQAKDMAINATYEDEITNWIITTYIKDKQLFKIVWRGLDRTLYKRAMSLPGARYSNGGVIVSAGHYAEVEDFAQLYDFSVSKSAKQLIEKEREKFVNAELINIKVKEKKAQKDGLKEILETEGIIDDLKDED